MGLTALGLQGPICRTGSARMKIVICRKVLEEAWTFHHAVGGGGTTACYVSWFINRLGAASAREIR